MLRRLLATAALMTSMAGCFAADSAGGDGIDDDYMDDQPPPGGCQTICPGPASGDGSPEGGPCIDTNDCSGDGICAAAFDGEVHSFECQVACIPPMDETQWCADDQSCCEGACSARGFCLPPGEGLDSGGSDSGPTTGSTGDASTGDTGASSGGGVSSTGAGSSTG